MSETSRSGCASVRGIARLGAAALVALGTGTAPALVGVAGAQSPSSGPAAVAAADARIVVVPTRVVIRAVARDAKLIGDGVGGARITVVDATTGETLAEGRQRGGTGDTERIMSTPRTRGMSVYDTPGAASFVAELALDGPTLVNISALGPLGVPQAIQSATKRMLLVPGGHIEGDGVILELHGFAVEVLEPEPLTPVTGSFPVRVRVRMMCGCPLTPGGLWDSDPVEIVARLTADGTVIAESALEYAGQPSTFEGTLTRPVAPSTGDLELEVLASDPTSKNAGRHVIPVGGEQQVDGER